MANEGTRAVVQDPLAPNPREQRPNRSLQLGGVQTPHTPSAASLTNRDGLQEALQGVEGVLQKEFENKKDQWLTEGKIAYQSGVTEAQMLESGNAFTAQGYRTSQARDQVNNWFTDQTVAMDETGKTMDPKDYAKQLQQQRADTLSRITDPQARKVASAAFEDMSPRLAATQAIKHNEYNRVEGVKSFSTELASTAPTSATASRREPGGQLSLSPVPVGPILTPSAKDRDVGIRTMLGEAGNEGAEGLAAVAHVLKNRTTDSRYPKSVAEVSLQPQQFSTWNAGAGGNAIPYNAKPGSPAYERAGEVFDAVMAGKHVDQTGGATHYYSPAGMQKLVNDGDQTNTVPRWLDEETKRGGGRIKIGGHIFVGKTNGAGNSHADEAQSTLNLNPQERALYDRHVNNLNGPGGVDNPPDENNPQGSRSTVYVAVQEHNGRFYNIPTVWNGKREVEKYTRPNGTSLDVPNKAALDNVEKAGWDNFPSYRTPEEADARYAQMHKYMDKDTAAYMSGKVKPVPQNEVTQRIMTSALKPEDKAAAVADAMRRTLDAGDDKLFNDAGGIAMMQNLRAKAADIDEVIKAKKRFDDKKLTEFNTGNIKFEDDIKARAEKGEDRDSILADIDKRRASGLMNDAQARALATGALDKIRAESKGDNATQMANPDMLGELGGLYQGIASGSLEFKSAAAQGKKIAEKYGATEKDVQKIVGKMFTEDQSYQTRLREKVEAAVKTKAEQDGIKANVDRALSNGNGLAHVTGSLKATNNRGNPVTITAEEYGVQQVKDKWAKEITTSVNNGTLDRSQAKGMLERKVALELQNHGVVDKETVDQINGSLQGNIVKDGKVSDEARQAYDTWLNLKTTGDISPAYMAKLVPDPTTRNLLEHAFLFDGGTLSKDQALLKAHEVLNDPNRDPNDKINKDVVWKQKLDVDLKRVLLERTHGSFLDSWFATKDPSERERILTNNTVAQNYVTQRAEMYHALEPREHGEVSLEKGLQDLQRNSTPVMGNLVITKPGKELSKTMGLDGFGPDAAEAAIEKYVRDNGAKLWPQAYDEQGSTLLGGKRMFDTTTNPVTGANSAYDHQSKIAGAISTLGTIDRQFSPQGIARAISSKYENPDNLTGSRRDAPPVHITYDAENGIMTVDLYKDAEMKQTLGSPKHLNVKAIGAEYAKAQTEPTRWAKTWNSMFKTGASGLNGDNMENVYNAN
jgi:spore germination cell wall hydrolase CwlJ-like protein